jgi:predicted DNA-binding protein with PD1-like motif
MKHKLIHAGEQRTYALIFDKDEEAVEGLRRFAESEKLAASQFTAIGAFRSAVLGYFDWERKDYKRIPVDAQVEVVSLLGDVATKDGKPAIHAHVVLADSEGKALGGHLLEGHVRPTLEVVLTESPAELKRVMDQETGLALIGVLRG